MASGDELLLQRIVLATQGTRALLCALARRGKALRRDEPERAERLLGAVLAHPLYKGARLLFDMLELEDLMLDGPRLEQMDGFFEASQASRLLARLEELSRELGTAAAPEAAPSQTIDPRGFTLPPEPAPPLGWPELTSADYLYDMVVLGTLRQASRVAAARAAT